MLTEDSTTFEYDDTDRRIALTGAASLDESVAMPGNLHSMSIETMEMIHAEIVAKIQLEERNMKLKQNDLDMAFESFEKLSFSQKYVRRNCKARQGISDDIYMCSAEVSQRADNIKRLKDKLKNLQGVKRTALYYADLKSQHKLWQEGITHSILSGQNKGLASDSIFLADCRLSLGLLSFRLHLRSLGRYLHSSKKDSGAYADGNQLYLAISNLKWRLVNLAQACDEIRMCALPNQDCADEVRRINGLTDSAYASELMMMARIRGWEVTREDEDDALREYKWANDIAMKHNGRRQRKEGAAMTEKKRPTNTCSSEVPNEIDIADLLYVEKQTFADQIGVSKLNLIKLKASLDDGYKRLDNMTVAQKFIQRGKSGTKGMITGDIYHDSVKIIALTNEISYLLSEMKRLEFIQNFCVSVLISKTIKGLQTHGSFLRCNFDAVVCGAKIATMEEVNFESSGYSHRQLCEIIGAYDMAKVCLEDALEEKLLAATDTATATRRARSAVSDDDAPLFLTGNDFDRSDDGIDIDSHVSGPMEKSHTIEEYLGPVPRVTEEEGRGREAFLTEELDHGNATATPPVVASAFMEEKEEKAQGLLTKAQKNLEAIPLEYIYRMSYIQKCLELEECKKNRKKYVNQFALSHVAGNYSFDDKSSIAFQLANDANHDLIESARICDEARIHALPQSERLEEYKSLLEMNELDYLVRIFQLAGAQGWNITKREQSLAFQVAENLGASQKTPVLQLASS